MVNKSLAALCGIAMIAAATPADARINQRQAHQHQRIHAGVKSGSLTVNEAQHLRAQQRSIARYEARSRADGPGLTRVERTRIEAKQDRASTAIARQKHDAQRRR